MVNNNIVKAVRATVKFSEQIQVDGYMLPNGEFRVGKTSSSIAVGFGKDWLGQLEGNPLKALQSNGFTGSEEIVRLDSIKGGGTLAKTISLSDFKTLIIYASGKGKIKTQALLSALLDVGLEDWFRLSFGLNQQTLEQKQAKFDQAYIASIKWLEEDRQDIKVIAEIDDRFINNLDYANWSLT